MPAPKQGVLIEKASRPNNVTVERRGSLVSTDRFLQLLP
jgi:hypothetical protein